MHVTSVHANQIHMLPTDTDNSSPFDCRSTPGDSKENSTRNKRKSTLSTPNDIKNKKNKCSDQGDAQYCHHSAQDLLDKSQSNEAYPNSQVTKTPCRNLLDNRSLEGISDNRDIFNYSNEDDYNFLNEDNYILDEDDYNTPVEDDYKDTSDKNKIILPTAKVKKTVSVEMKIEKTTRRLTKNFGTNSEELNKYTHYLKKVPVHINLGVGDNADKQICNNRIKEFIRHLMGRMSFGKCRNSDIDGPTNQIF